MMVSLCSMVSLCAYVLRTLPFFTGPVRLRLGPVRWPPAAISQALARIGGPAKAASQGRAGPARTRRAGWATLCGPCRLR